MNYYRYKPVFNNTTILNNPVDVETKTVQYDKEYIKANLRIPVIKGIKNKEIENNINSNLENDILEFSKSIEKEAKDYNDERIRNGEELDPYTISTIYDVTYNKNNIISISILYHQNIRGKDYYIKTSYNYNTISGRSLSLNDLFIPRAKFVDLINEEIIKEIKQNSSRYFPDTLENFKGITEDQPFYLEDKNMVIYFGFHEIAPTRAGIPTIKLPFSLFKGAIKNKFLSNNMSISYH